MNISQVYTKLILNIKYPQNGFIICRSQFFFPTLVSLIKSARIADAEEIQGKNISEAVDWREK